MPSRAAARREAVLAAAFDALPIEAYILDHAGHVVDTNRAGRGRPLGAMVPPEAISAATAIRGLRVVVVAPTPDAGALLATATARWKLTTCERDVLGHVVQGDTNKQIADAVGCAESTTEVHVHRIVRKAGANSRNALVAAFWSGRAA